MWQAFRAIMTVNTPPSLDLCSSSSKAKMGYGSRVAAISVLINRSYAQTAPMLLPRTIVYAMITLTHTCGASFCLTMSWAVERKNDLAAGSAPSMSFGIPSQIGQ
ncbi:hypothetical protein U9M48_024117 [Paspalum notatum var. saurae]|uniref:Uncharacterized protein n=1 Tax=Paspalum notatum var. saurae TaxID=547442 RepID=A0AAQ3TQP6_PASNO